jgi:hypothetical protein
MTDTADRAAERARALVAITSAVDVLDYTQATAAHHGRLLAHVRRSGSPRGAHDLIIAAHAAETGRTILSRDAKARFGDLPGVTAIDAGPLFRSSDREAAVGVEEVQVSGIHSELDPVADADRAARVNPRRPQRFAFE